jgi:chemotaxis protein methyltransferase CheR
MKAKAKAEIDLLADPLFPELKARVIKKTGLAYYHDKENDLARILAARLESLGYADCAAYAAHLDGKEGGGEMDELISELTIGETYFFRHPEVFTALRKHIIPEILQRNAARKSLSVWSAGCSSGAEAHSVSILLSREFSSAMAGWKTSIIGTDIDKKFLAQAKSGLYQDWAIRTTSEGERAAYFERTPKGWQLRPKFREAVSFACHNLIEDALPNPDLGLADLDIIFCRNVAIYFSREQIRRLMDRFYDSLREGGWLVTGPAEIGADRPSGFNPVDLDGLIVFQKGERPARAPDTFWAPVYDLSDEPLLLPAWPSPVEEPQAGMDTEAQEQEDDASLLERLSERGQWLAAQAPARRILAQTDAGLELTLKAVQVLVEIGDFAQAEQVLKRLLFIDRKCQMAYYHLGILLSCQGDEKMARKAFRNAYDLAAQRPVGEAVPGAEGLTAGKLAAMAKLRALHGAGE